MKKAYISPNAKIINLAFEGLVATSGKGGLDDGSSVGNETPDGDDDGNCYSNHRGIWNSQW